MAETITIMPMVHSTISTGNSNRSIFSRRKKSCARTIAAEEPSSTSDFITLEKASDTKAPERVVTRPVPGCESTAKRATSSSTRAPTLTVSAERSPRHAP